MRMRTTIHGTRPHGRAGFSLVELMLAMGILAIGMTMVATAFPTAILQTQRSAAETTGGLIAENAEAIIRARLNHEDLNGHLPSPVGTLGPLGLFQIAGPDQLGARVPLADRRYDPDGDGNTEYGWLLAGCQMTAGENDYLFVVIPYRRFPGVDYGSEGEPVMAEIPVGIDGEPRLMTFVLDDARRVGAGSPVVVSRPASGLQTGTCALIADVDVDDREALLTNDMGMGSSPLVQGHALVVPGGTGQPGDEGAPSPALGCHVFRTPLRLRDTSPPMTTVTP